MAELVDLYYIVGTIVGLITIGGAVWGVYKRRRGREPSEATEPKAKRLRKKKERQIACDNCQTVFTPKWKERETFWGGVVQYAVCPECEEENEFELEEDEEEE